MRPREEGRYEITNVPAIIRERDRQLTGRDRRNLNPVTLRYERVCFEKKFVYLEDRAGAPMARRIVASDYDASACTPSSKDPLPEQPQAIEASRHGVVVEVALHD